MLDGFVISGGNGTSVKGGGMLLDWGASPSLSNLVFAGNNAFDGGGMYVNNFSKPLLLNVVFASNHADWSGGGMYVGWYSEPALTNVVFFGNRAEWDGGAIMARTASPKLNNVTMSGNTSSHVGGVSVVAYQSLLISNSILWGNTGAQIYSQQANPYISVSYSIVQGGWTGTGNLDADPQFVDAAKGDLHLQRTSPAVNSGSNAAVTVATDLDGNPRIVSGVVDRGAYEVQNLPPAIAVDETDVAVEEGQTAANTGTVSDPDGTVVALTASVGTIANNGNGTWSWSFVTSDGPDQGQTVTVTAKDSDGA